MRWEDVRIERVVHDRTNIGQDHGQVTVSFELSQNPPSDWREFAQRAAEYPSPHVSLGFSGNLLRVEGPRGELDERWLEFVRDAVDRANTQFRELNGYKIEAQAEVDSEVESWDIPYV